MPAKKALVLQNVQSLFAQWKQLRSEVAAEESRVQSLASYIELCDQIDSLEEQADELEDEMSCAEIDGDEDALQELEIDLEFCRDDIAELEQQIAQAYRPGHSKRLTKLQELRSTLEEKGWFIIFGDAQKRPALRRIKKAATRSR